MGAILFLAGDERIMFPSSRIMIHDPAFGNSLKPGMKPLELEERLDHLKKIRKETADIISSVTGRPLEEILEKTSRDSYFDVTQLESLYGQACARTIINNCDRQLYLGGQDIDTATYISKRVNKTLDSILNLPIEKAYYLERGKKPLLSEKYEYEDVPVR